MTRGKYWTGEEDHAQGKGDGGWVFILLIIIWTVAVSWWLTVTPAAQGGPKFPQRGVEIIDALLKVPENQQLARGTDEDRRRLTRIIIEQLICEFPTAGYTWKSASPTRPPSKDAIGIVVNGELWGWDWQNGSTRQRQVKAGQVAEEMHGQHIIKLGCVNHLGTPEPEPEPKPCPTCPPDLRKELDTCTGEKAGLERLVMEEQLRANTAELELEVSRAEVERLKQRRCRVWMGLPIPCKVE